MSFNLFRRPEYDFGYSMYSQSLPFTTFTRQPYYSPPNNYRHLIDTYISNERKLRNSYSDLDEKELKHDKLREWLYENLDKNEIKEIENKIKDQIKEEEMYRSEAYLESIISDFSDNKKKQVTRKR